MTRQRAHSRAARRRLGWGAIALAAAVLALAGCGDDEEGTTTRSTTTDAEATTTGETTTGTTTTGTTTTSGGQGGSGGTPSDGSYNPEQDTAQNDIEPPEGSPAAEFEEQCEKHPESCG
jgi:hypothetical protein